MNQEAIRRLRRKYIITAMLTLVISMGVTAGLICVLNLVLARNEIRDTMEYIAERDGEMQDVRVLYAGDGSGLPSEENAQDYVTGPLDGPLGQGGYDVREFFYDVFDTEDPRESEPQDSQDEEAGYYTPYFAVIYREDGTVETIKVNHIQDLTAQEAKGLADYARTGGKSFGRYGSNYFYSVSDREDGGQIVIYLDSTSQVNTSFRILYSALFLTALGAVFLFIFVRLFSYRAIEPAVRNVELQKQFITNASHELKTPLAVIKANTEMQELLGGESEWTQSTLRQIDRMSALIHNLVLITRTQEKESAVRTDTDVSGAVREMTDAYLPVARQEGKTLESQIPEGLTMKAVDSEIRQLVTLLLDNAVKYCDAGGIIRVSVRQKGHDTWICVSNSYAEGKNVDYSRFFERFYRGDEAHTIDGGSGFGIGLSIAESLVQKYNGSIRAEWKDGFVSFLCLLKS